MMKIDIMRFLLARKTPIREKTLGDLLILYNYRHFNIWLLPERALKKAWRLLTHQAVLQRNWEAQFLHPSGRVGLLRWLLRPCLKLHDLVSPTALQILLESFFAAPLLSCAAYPLSMLLTFFAWLERYG